MKREEKNEHSRQKILEGALREFSEKGYGGASLNAVCAENELSKGIIYHYFKDKDELYLLCVEACFDALTDHLERAAAGFSGGAEARLRAYFDARFSFFAEHPLFLGLFADAALEPPAHLKGEIARRRAAFDVLNGSILSALLERERLRGELTVDEVVEDFRLYVDFFNVRFPSELRGEHTGEALLREREKRCHRQVALLLHGVLEGENEKED